MPWQSDTENRVAFQEEEETERAKSTRQEESGVLRKQESQCGCRAKRGRGWREMRLKVESGARVSRTKWVSHEGVFILRTMGRS